MKRYIWIFVIGILLLIVYKQWFLTGLIASGDFWPQFSYQARFYAFLPEAWHPLINNGLGGSSIFLHWNFFFLNLPIYLFGTVFHFPYEVVERVGYLFPILILSVISPYIWSRYFFGTNNFLHIVTFLIFSLNTYILLLVGGGQVGIAIAYLIAPLVLLQFIKLINTPNIRHSISAGLLFALQVGIDLRIAYVTMIVVFLYLILGTGYSYSKKKAPNILSVFFYILFIPIVVTVLLHAFWILPFILVGKSSAIALGSSFNTLEAVKFFSFATFESAMGLLHPFWPENVFGKISFMKAEFLILPLLAFSSLLFLNGKLKFKSLNKKIIVFFALLGSLGAFLAKGANEPFGQVYLWMFEHIPGFIMFRDPTKFYLLVALSYSILIPFSIVSIYNWLNSKFKVQNKKLSFSKLKMLSNAEAHFKIKKFIPSIFLLFIFCFLLFLIRPALFGELQGNFKQNTLPVEYTNFTQFIENQPQFFRTLWVPQLQRFGYYASNHPTINAIDLFKAKSQTDFISKLQRPETEKFLQEAGVKYVIIPFDSEGELFLDDRKYSEKNYLIFVESLKKISWLKYEQSFGKIVVFSVSNPKDHFWVAENNKILDWKKLSNTRYQITVPQSEEKKTIIFSEGYDPNWIAYVDDKKISSQRFHNQYNSFTIPEKAKMIDIYFKPQHLMNIGLWVSFVTIIGCLFFILRYR